MGRQVYSDAADGSDYTRSVTGTTVTIDAGEVESPEPQTAWPEVEPRCTSGSLQANAADDRGSQPKPAGFC